MQINRSHIALTATTPGATSGLWDLDFLHYDRR